MKKALIIGGGFAGCAAAHQLALRGGWDVTVVEKLPYLGSGVKTRFCGGHPYTYGPRHFLTPKEHIYAFLNKYVPLRSCGDHEFWTYVERDSEFYNFPIHYDDIPRMPDQKQIESELAALNMAAIAQLSKDDREKLNPAELRRLNLAKDAKNFEEYWLYSIGRTLYDKFVNDYSRKMWMLEDNKQIDTFSWSPKGVAIKEGSRAAWDSAISAYPIALNGYDDYFTISTAEAKVLLSTEIEHYDIPKKTVVLNGENKTFDVIVNTISPDVVFNFCYGELPYIGRDLYRIVLPVEHVMPEHVFFCYYAGKEQFTRVVEYKKFTHYKAPTTLITLEVPSRKNKLYPVPFKSEQEKAKKYFSEMPDGVFSIGRMGTYQYGLDIDDTIDQAMQIAAAL